MDNFETEPFFWYRIVFRLTLILLLFCTGIFAAIQIVKWLR